MGILPDTQNYGLCMHRECRGRFPRHRLQRKPLVNDPGVHHVMHVGIANPRWRGKRSGIHDTSATRNFMYLVRGLYRMTFCYISNVHVLNHCNSISMRMRQGLGYNSTKCILWSVILFLHARIVLTTGRGLFILLASWQQHCKAEIDSLLDFNSTDYAK